MEAKDDSITFDIEGTGAMGNKLSLSPDVIDVPLATQGNFSCLDDR